MTALSPLMAMLGLPYAFASHFAPAQMTQSLSVYRNRFRPSPTLDRPHVMLGFNVFAADTDEEAAVLATSVMQAVVALRKGQPRRVQPPIPGFADTLAPEDRALLEGFLACSAIGSPATVRRAVEAFVARTGADELILSSMMFDHAARLRSYELTAGVLSAVGGPRTRTSAA